MTTMQRVHPKIQALIDNAMAQADAYRDAWQALEALPGKFAPNSVEHAVYRDSLRQEIQRLRDAEDEMVREIRHLRTA